MAAFPAGLSGVTWSTLVPALGQIAISLTFVGLFIAVSVSEVLEAQTLSNFFRVRVMPRCLSDTACSGRDPREFNGRRHSGRLAACRRDTRRRHPRASPLARRRPP